MATHSSILAWKNPMDRGAWQATVHSPQDCKELDTIEATFHLGLLKLATCALGPPSDLVKIF